VLGFVDSRAATRVIVGIGIGATVRNLGLMFSVRVIRAR